ncbi:conjugal transfer protein TraH [Desulfoferrobacter suflitae]|uniref:conjugal transfer protein TraH n=1 Tax=Desulfoferrobacter suflitae TaxID=2865782 RepID=UPI0028699154|nr:conjugal transfer protein TraH [Desulfoferrobacter suflitae]
MKIGCALFLVCVFFAVVSPVHASLTDALDGMFMSTGTLPQAYESQTRQGFVGGSYSLRTPLKNMNIISFAAPRLDAGCGGIDLFMGSFSFINAEQFTNLIRAIGANAVGYAFKMAIQAICSQCAAVLTDLENKLNALNRALKNTCAIANAVVNDVGNAIAGKDQASQVGTMLETAQGAVDDLFSSIQNLFSDSNSAVKAAPEDNPNAGNLVWKALFNNNTAAFIGDPTASVDDFWGSNSLLMAQYIMSITGSVIIPTDEDFSAEEDCPSGARCDDRSVEIGPKLTFKDLINGNTAEEKPKYWKCNTTADQMSCQSPALADFNFIGTRGYTNMMLFGNADGPDYGIESDSIVGRIMAGETLNSAQQAFVNAISVPILKMLIDVQREPVALEMIARTSAPVIQEEMAIALGTAILKAARSAFDGQNNARKPDFFDKNLKTVQDDMNACRAMNAQEHVQILKELKELVDYVRQSMPASLS